LAVLVIHYLKHWLAATAGVFGFVAIMSVRTVTFLVFSFNFLSASLALKCGHSYLE
jgi:hypothetical protein